MNAAVQSPATGMSLACPMTSFPPSPSLVSIIEQGRLSIPSLIDNNLFKKLLTSQSQRSYLLGTLLVYLNHSVLSKGDMIHLVGEALHTFDLGLEILI